MYRLSDNARAATQELLYLHVDLGRRKVVPWPDFVLQNLQNFVALHARYDHPSWIGRKIGMPVKV